MRSGLTVFAILLALAGCDNKQEAGADAAAASASAAAIASASATPAATSSGPKPLSSLKMPERPIPKPDNTVSATMPIEVQQKAIAYMVAMRAPRFDDANADPEYAKDLAEKLKPISMGIDHGHDKGRMNRVNVIADGRQIDLLMAQGCNAKTPFEAVVQHAGVPLATLVAHGVFVIRCNDERIQCLQSTREPDDVLCTTAPRHK